MKKRHRFAYLIDDKDRPVSTFEPSDEFWDWLYLEYPEDEDDQDDDNLFVYEFDEEKMFREKRETHHYRVRIPNLS